MVDLRPWLSHNFSMSIDAAIPSEVLERMQEAADRAAQGVRDRDELDEAFAEMSRLREVLRQRIGTVNVAVELIRDARDR